MFHRHHDPESLAGRIDELMVAVFVADDRERLERLAQHLAPDFVYMSPQTVVEGPGGLSEAFSRFRQDPRHPTALRRTSAVDQHHAHFRYSWERSERDHLALAGWSFGWTNAEGLVARIVSFDRLDPRASRRTAERVSDPGAAVLAAVDGVLQGARALGRREPSVRGIALVGSCARGTPGPDSDIDLVVLTSDEDGLGRREDWFTRFGAVHLVQQRQFGPVAERRLRRSDGIEIEIGLAPLSWAGTDPVDPGTARVVREGFRVVLDTDGTLAHLAVTVAQQGTTRTE